MHIINLTYNVSLDKLDEYLNDHVNFLNEQIPDRNELINIINNDAFKINDLADYELIKFVPTRTCKELDFLKE